MHSGRWAKAAHLFRPILAPNLKTLSSARHRADVGALSTRSSVCSGHRGANFYAQVGPQGVRKISKT
eukprot:2426914-Prymnesium_polylepis.3